MNYSSIIMANEPCISTIEWLRHVFLPRVVEKLNTSRYRRMLALNTATGFPKTNVI